MNEIRAAQEELSKTFSEAGQSFYARARARAGAGRRRSGRGVRRRATARPARRPADDVVEADYEIVDDARSSARRRQRPGDREP